MNIEHLYQRYLRAIENRVRSEVSSKVRAVLATMADKYGYHGMPAFYDAFDPAIEKIVARGVEHVLRQEQGKFEDDVIALLKARLDGVEP